MATHPGAFEIAVLLAVLRLGDEAYGRRILREVQERLERGVSAGAVQVTLGRLEQKGLLSSELGAGTEVRAGRPRRYYTVAPAGRGALNAARAAADSLWRGFKRTQKGLA